MSSWIKFFTSANVIVFRLSKGRLGSKLGRQSVLLLHTIGRKTGKHHITSLAYYRDGNDYLIVGSNWGMETQPGWYHNLLAQPETTIQVGSRTINVKAHLPSEERYQTLWRLLTSKNKQYVAYQKVIQRRIPIVILTPI